MHLAILGYGKMGKLIERFAPDYGFAVKLRLNRESNPDGSGITSEKFRGIDLAVEFSAPSATLHNIEHLASLGINVVVGTTGWWEHLDRARAVVEQNHTGLVWSANYSIGVQVFSQIVSEAARRFAREKEYGAWAWEIHHAAKKDALSGTLLRLIQEMKTSGYDRPIPASASRAGAHPGTHEIGFDSPADTITLRHTARNREGFARGALRAARWLAGKQGFYEFRDLLNEL